MLCAGLRVAGVGSMDTEAQFWVQLVTGACSAEETNGNLSKSPRLDLEKKGQGSHSYQLQIC